MTTNKEQVELQTYGHHERPRLFLRRAAYFDGCVELFTTNKVLAIVRRDALERALREVSS